MMNISLSEDSREVIFIEPNKIVGTKWDSWCDRYKGSVSVEFVDNKNCIYTSKEKKYPVTYTVYRGKLFIGNIEGPFELRGDILYNNDLPAFQAA